MLPQDFHANGALSGDHQRVVVWMHIGKFFLRGQLIGMQAGLVVTIAAQNHRCAAASNSINFDSRGCHRHHNRRPRTEFLRGQCDPLCMVAGRGANHAAFQVGRRQVRHLVVRPAQLERKHRLHILALEQYFVFQRFRTADGALQRAFDGHVVHAGGKYAFQVIDFHGTLNGQLPI